MTMSGDYPPPGYVWNDVQGYVPNGTAPATWTPWGVYPTIQPIPQPCPTCHRCPTCGSYAPYTPSIAWTFGTANTAEVVSTCPSASDNGECEHD